KRRCALQTCSLLASRSRSSNSLSRGELGSSVCGDGGASSVAPSPGGSVRRICICSRDLRCSRGGSLGGGTHTLANIRSTVNTLRRNPPRPGGVPPRREGDGEAIQQAVRSALCAARRYQLYQRRRPPSAAVPPTTPPTIQINARTSASHRSHPAAL